MPSTKTRFAPRTASDPETEAAVVGLARQFLRSSLAARAAASNDYIDSPRHYDETTRDQ
jgi:hypothetical protein